MRLLQDRIRCFRYVSRVLSGVRLEELNKCMEKARTRCKKGKVSLFFDMLWCAMRYGAGYHDYVMFGFYDMDGAHRDTYVTRLRNKKMIARINNPDTADLFDRKVLFYPRFQKYLGREFLLVENMTMEQFQKFMEHRQEIFAKPDVGESGKGIEKLKREEFHSLEDMFSYIKGRGFGTIEEALVQHEALQKLYPLSVNTLRIVTLLKKDDRGQWESHCVYAVQKMGNSGKVVDNLENGGLFCPVDRETGKLTGVGHMSSLETKEVHPYTGIPLIGYTIPYVKEAIALCKKAALEEPAMRFVGWDVCIKPDGPAIVEGNDYPGYDFWQQPEHTPDRIGLWKYYKEMIPEIQ